MKEQLVATIQKFAGDDFYVFLESPVGAHRSRTGATRCVRDVAIAHASARFMLLIASSISCVFLKPIVAQSTPAF
jgi:hypothetical protein